MEDKLHTELIELAHNPQDPSLSIKIAMEYEIMGQTASAISFYLRAAEYGYKTHPTVVYCALLKASQSFKHQKNRETTVKNLILRAIAYIPNRPEAWFLLSQYHERKREWQESYTSAEVGIFWQNSRHEPLPFAVWISGSIWELLSESRCWLVGWASR